MIPTDLGGIIEDSLLGLWERSSSGVSDLAREALSTIREHERKVAVVL